MKRFAGKGNPFSTFYRTYPIDVSGSFVCRFQLGAVSPNHTCPASFQKCLDSGRVHRSACSGYFQILNRDSWRKAPYYQNNCRHTAPHRAVESPLAMP